MVFLRYMVRSIVGTLLEVGRGRLNLEEIENFFEPHHPQAGPVAPAKGLCLVRVLYEPRSRIITRHLLLGSNNKNALDQ